MVESTQVLTIANAVIDAFLAALATRPAGALLTTPTLGLFVGATNPTPGDTYATYTAPTFHGYAPAVVTFSGPVNIAPNTQALLFTANFIATSGGVISDTVTGYWLSDGAANFYAAERLATPVPFANPGDFLTLNFAFQLQAIQGQT